jgi:hypothetical protein
MITHLKHLFKISDTPINSMHRMNNDKLKLGPVDLYYCKSNLERSTAPKH